ncbi:hypothetical protein [Streptomyces sp. NPDC055299]
MCDVSTPLPADPEGPAGLDEGRVLRAPDCPVETSSRLRPRAVGGFGHDLARLAAEGRARDGRT